MENTPLATAASPIQIFDDVSPDRESCKAGAHCIAWVLYSTTDSDMVSRSSACEGIDTVEELGKGGRKRKTEKELEKIGRAHV